MTSDLKFSSVVLFEPRCNDVFARVILYFWFVFFVFKQMFSRFIEGRSFVSSQDSLFAFFDNCLEKVTTLMCRILFWECPTLTCLFIPSTGILIIVTSATLCFSLLCKPCLKAINYAQFPAVVWCTHNPLYIVEMIVGAPMYLWLWDWARSWSVNF